MLRIARKQSYMPSIQIWASTCSVVLQLMPFMAIMLIRHFFSAGTWHFLQSKGQYHRCHIDGRTCSLVYRDTQVSGRRKWKWDGYFFRNNYPALCGYMVLCRSTINTAINIMSIKQLLEKVITVLLLLQAQWLLVRHPLWPPSLAPGALLNFNLGLTTIARDLLACTSTSLCLLSIFSSRCLPTLYQFLSTLCWCDMVWFIFFLGHSKFNQTARKAQDSTKCSLN
jgi:hypothetical protein